MISLPVDRALSIYGALADRSETKGVRDRLSKHLMKRYIEGEQDEHVINEVGRLAHDVQALAVLAGQQFVVAGSQAHLLRASAGDHQSAVAFASRQR